VIILRAIKDPMKIWVTELRYQMRLA